MTELLASTHLSLPRRCAHITHSLSLDPAGRMQATVGAGLPVIATLKHLVDTGDRILRVEGVFSGTLSFIFNSLAPGRAFSDVVREVR